MNSWSETDIAIVYYSGLAIALMSSILVILYIRPAGSVMRKIFGKFQLVWRTSFILTLLIAGILGALTVSFRDCEGSYEYLLKSRPETIMKGAHQVASSFDYLMIIGIIWLIILLVIFLKYSGHTSHQAHENQNRLQK